MNLVKNAGKYNKKIMISRYLTIIDNDGFPFKQKVIMLQPYASVKTTKGMTIIKNNSDFEKAYTNFTIRYPKKEITREMVVDFNGKTYTIEYLNNVNEANIELEIQAKEVTH